MTATFTAICVAQASAALLLTVVASGGRVSTALLFPAVLLQGCAAGIFSITRPIVTKELLGTESFGVISGMIATSCQTVTAVAPTLGSVLWTLGDGGYDGLRGGMVAMVLAGFVALILARRYSENESRGTYIAVEMVSEDEVRMMPVSYVVHLTCCTSFWDISNQCRCNSPNIRAVFNCSGRSGR